MVAGFFKFFRFLTPSLVLPSCFAAVDKQFRFPPSTIVIKEKVSGSTWTVGLRRFGEDEFSLYGEGWLRLSRDAGLVPGNFLFFKPRLGLDGPLLVMSVYGPRPSFRANGLAHVDDEHIPEAETIPEIEDVDFTVKASKNFRLPLTVAREAFDDEHIPEAETIPEVENVDFTVKASKIIRLPVTVAREAFAEGELILKVQYGVEDSEWLFEKRSEKCRGPIRFRNVLLGWRDIMQYNGIGLGDVCKFRYFGNDRCLRLMVVLKRQGP